MSRKGPGDPPHSQPRLLDLATSSIIDRTGASIFWGLIEREVEAWKRSGRATVF